MKVCLQSSHWLKHEAVPERKEAVCHRDESQAPSFQEGAGILVTAVRSSTSSPMIAHPWRREKCLSLHKALGHAMGRPHHYSDTEDRKWALALESALDQRSSTWSWSYSCRGFVVRLSPTLQKPVVKLLDNKVSPLSGIWKTRKVTH